MSFLEQLPLHILLTEISKHLDISDLNNLKRLSKNINSIYKNNLTIISINNTDYEINYNFTKIQRLPKNSHSYKYRLTMPILSTFTIRFNECETDSEFIYAQHMTEKPNKPLTDLDCKKYITKYIIHDLIFNYKFIMLVMLNNYREYLDNYTNKIIDKFNINRKQQIAGELSPNASTLPLIQIENPYITWVRPHVKSVLMLKHNMVVNNEYVIVKNNNYIINNNIIVNEKSEINPSDITIN